MPGVTVEDVARHARERLAAERSSRDTEAAEGRRKAIRPKPWESASAVRPTPTDGFALLPKAIVDRVGWRVKRGTLAGALKLDLLVLSAHLRLWQRNVGRERTLDYGQDELELDGWEYIVSEQRIAQLIYERVMLRRVKTPDPLDDQNFRRVYERVRDAHKRLKRLRVGGRVVLADLGPAIEGKIKRGKRWSLAGGPLADLTSDDLIAHPVAFTLTRPPSAPIDPSTPLIDVACHAARVLAVETDLIGEFDTGLTRTSLEGQRGRKAKLVRWARRQAKHDPDGFRHHSIGAYREGEIHMPGAPCTVPWIVLDIDRNDLDEAHSVTQRIVGELDRLGCELDTLLVSYSGGRGFHVRIPMGALGAPVFVDDRKASAVLRQFAALLTDEEVDGSVLSPRHLIRAIGSRHERSGLVCTAVPGRDFLVYSLDLVHEFAQRHYSFKLPDPLKASPAPALIGLLEEAAALASQRRPTKGSSPAMIRAIRADMTKGEQFYDQLSGRNEAAFRLSLHLLASSVDTAAAWQELELWNTSNSPPLSVGELRSTFGSASRYLQRQRPESMLVI